MGMTPKQQRFVEEYTVDMNATQAAIRAGYSAKTAGQIGEQNLRKLEIAEAVAERRAALAERCAVTVESLTAELEAARILAMSDDKGAAAAVSAIMGKAKLHGFLVERKEVTGKGGGPIQHDPALDAETVRREIEELFAEPFVDAGSETTH